MDVLSVCLSVYLHTRRKPFLAGQKRVGDSLRLDLQMVVNYREGAGN